MFGSVFHKKSLHATSYYFDVTFAYLALAWNLVGGLAGQVSYGNAIFGVGAYTSTLLFIRFNITPWLE